MYLKQNLQENIDKVKCVVTIQKSIWGFYMSINENEYDYVEHY